MFTVFKKKELPFSVTNRLIHSGPRCDDCATATGLDFANGEYTGFGSLAWTFCPINCKTLYGKRFIDFEELLNQENNYRWTEGRIKFFQAILEFYK